MVRQQNIETATTATSIISASTINFDHDRIVIITQNYQPEPIYFKLINLDISNTLKIAKNLANNQEKAITPQEALRKAMLVIMEKVNQLQKDKADTATRSLSEHLQSHPEGLQQYLEAQRVPDPCRSVEKLHESLPDCEKIFGQSQHLRVTQWMASID
ncbi:hypothetical protein O181_022661 [Austropuccinia psidii MF-1]|uniref:Uncharacterized protein n=1 Tax=Austropuccinia psidii MF-1 TaxID=1389203 RepID=A0A9Q3CHW3_9BASI|nr:hypothetical protein [Austropuccinia psidii MF-1]